MSFLLDTHAFLWFYSGDDKLPAKLRKTIEDSNQRCYISISSFWEIAIKMKTEKLILKATLRELSEFASENKIEIIPVELKHLETLVDLPFHHRDPFDRIIFAQAITENLTLISRDKIAKSYKVKVLW